VRGYSSANHGVEGESVSSVGVWGQSVFSNGVHAESMNGIALLSRSTNSIAIRGFTGSGSGYNPLNPADKQAGVWGDSSVSVGVLATSSTASSGALRAENLAPGWGRGVEAYVTTPNSSALYGVASAGATRAAWLQGDVDVTGSLTAGTKYFKIDHPLDPAHKYLVHVSVESPDMMNIYNGTVVLDANGEAWVEMPGWFEALNRDFRYQLTCIGGFAPVYIAEKVSGNRFKIGGGTPGLEVSWQVTGIRHDAFAVYNRIPVEEMKPAEEIGFYLHPQALGQPEELGVEWAHNREAMERLRVQRGVEKR